MSLEIEIRIGGTLIAYANAANISNLADLSDYEIRASTVLPISRDDPVTHHEGVCVNGHFRRQSVWSLIAKVATILALRENAADPRRAGLVKELPKELVAIARQAMKRTSRSK